MNEFEKVIGLTPEFIWNEKRIEDISNAIERYMKRGKKIPLEWIEEYNRLIKRKEGQHAARMEKV